MLLAGYHVRRLRQHCAPLMNQHDRSCVAGLTCGLAQKASVFIFHRFFGGQSSGHSIRAPVPSKGNCPLYRRLSVKRYVEKWRPGLCLVKIIPRGPSRTAGGLVFTLVHVSYAKILANPSNRSTSQIPAGWVAGARDQFRCRA